MLADLQAVEGGYVVRYERHWRHPVEDVWAWLTVNEKLVQWFPELEVEELRVGGIIKFNMPNGTFEAMDILELENKSVLTFTWDKDSVRFELSEETDGDCHVVFTEHLHVITDHTPRDLAGWHVCLDVIEALLDGKTIENRKSLWNDWYPKYKQLTDAALSNQV